MDATISPLQTPFQLRRTHLLSNRHSHPLPLDTFPTTLFSAFYSNQTISSSTNMEAPPTSPVTQAPPTSPLWVADQMEWEMRRHIEGYRFGMGQPHEPERRRDQFEWTEQDVERMWRDRYEAEQVRLLYTVSNPQEFPGIFADVAEESEERITPANLTSGGTPDDPQPGHDSYRQETVRDLNFYGEAVENYETGQYDPYRQDPVSPLPIRDDDSESGDEMEVETFNRLDFHLPSHDGRDCGWDGAEMLRDDVSDASDEYDPRPDTNFAPFASLEEMMLLRVRQEADQLTDEDMREDYIARTIDAIEQTDELFLPEWQDNTLANLAYMIGETEHARLGRLDEIEYERLDQRERDQAWDEAQDMRRELQTPSATQRELVEEFHRLEAEFSTSKNVEYRQWQVFKHKISKAAKSAVRRTDIMSWYPWLPENLRDCIRRLANFHRQNACTKLNIKIREAFYHGESYEPQEMDEEDSAAVYGVQGDSFGFEGRQDTVNGFAHFQEPSRQISASAAIKAVEVGSMLRCCRLLLAWERMGDGPGDAHHSDYFIGPGVLAWLYEASEYLRALRTTDVRAANMAPRLHRKIDNVLAYFSTIEGMIFQIEQPQAGEDNNGALQASYVVRRHGPGEGSASE